MINGSAARKLAQTATTAGARYVDALLLFVMGEKTMTATIGEGEQCNAVSATNRSSRQTTYRGPAELDWTGGGVADMPHISQREFMMDSIEAQYVLLLFHQFHISLTKLFYCPLFVTL